jgi:predicted RNase H-like HicB family nuclease
MTDVCSVVRRIGIEREESGRWLTEIPDLPGVMAYGQTQAEAVAKVKALALRVMADRLEHGAVSTCLRQRRKFRAIPALRSLRSLW